MDIQFDTESFIWKSYMIVKLLPIARGIELIDKQEFAKAALDMNSKPFIVYIAVLKARKLTMTIYFFQTLLFATLQKD